MKILLDSSYFLPAVGIALHGLPEDTPIRLMRKGHEIFLSEISIFELSAKASKYVVGGKIEPIEVARGLSAIIHDKRVERIPFHEASVQTFAFKLRAKLSDFIDCLIFSSAIRGACDMLVTEDDALHKLIENKETAEMIQAMKQDFRVVRASFIL